MSNIQYKETLKNTLGTILISPGTLTYCIDTYELYYDLNYTTRVNTTRFLHCLTEVSRLSISSPNTAILYVVNETKSVYKYITGTGWSKVLTNFDLNDILGIFSTLEINTIIKNGVRIAPRTLAKAVYTENGDLVEDRLKLLSKVGTSTGYATATSASQKIFTIPFPFDDYIANGNSMILSTGTVFLDSSRYSINGTTLTLASGEAGLDIGRTLTFIFIFNSSVPLSDVLSTLDGKYIANNTVSANKLEKYSNSIILDDNTSIATSQAVKNLNDALSIKINAVNTLNSLYATTIGTGAALTVTNAAFTLTDQAILHLRLHTNILSSATLKVNTSANIPIYVNYTDRIAAGDAYSGDELVLSYNQIDARFYVTSGLPYTIQSSEGYTVVTTENAQTFRLDEMNNNSLGFNPSLDKMNVYHNGIKLIANVHYTNNNDGTISLKDYVAEIGDTINVECLRLVKSSV